MRKTLYLHIGTPKTGSSAIQTFLEQNRETLRSKGIDYPGGPAKKTQFSAQSGNGRDLCLALPLLNAPPAATKKSEPFLVWKGPLRIAVFVPWR